MTESAIFQNSVQINNGLTDTSGDGSNTAFDVKYGIMFCTYMPGRHGCYGESRGRISLSYFPAAQPTNIRFVDVSCDEDDYAPNILGLGEGKVRVFYEKDSCSDGDHLIVYRDFNFLDESLTPEKPIELKNEDGKIVPFTESAAFEYLERRGYKNHYCLESEQVNIGGQTLFRDANGRVYGSTPSYFAEPVLWFSDDDMATVEFFAVFPRTAQYEFDYKIKGNRILAIYRTDLDDNAIFLTSSDDMGKTWSESIAIEESIQCRPRIITYGEKFLYLCNFYQPDTGYRPDIQQGRAGVRIYYGDSGIPEENVLVSELQSKYGIINTCLSDILGDVYMTYSASVLALEYRNGDELVRGKDAIRYVCLGNLTE